MKRLASLSTLSLLALLLAACITDKDKEDDLFVSKNGPRSLSKGLYSNSELGYSFAYPKAWFGGLFKAGEAVAYWSPDTGAAYVTVYECPADSFSLCDTFRDGDSTYGVPGLQTRQGVEVIVGLSADTTSTRISVLQRIHFRRGSKAVMFWLYGAHADFAAGTDFKRIDSSLTFF